MATYANKTTVPADKSRNEIERTLMRFGASSFAYGVELERSVIMFEARGRRIRFQLAMPDRNSREFTHTPGRGQKRSTQAAEDAYDQAVRQQWRALALIVKAKLEAVESGIVEFESEFLAHVVLPNGSTVGDWARPQLEVAYEGGSMPALLAGS